VTSKIRSRIEYLILTGASLTLKFDFKNLASLTGFQYDFR